MKKIVIAVAAVVFAAVAAQAQSARIEVGIMHDSWKGSLALNQRVEQKVKREEARQAQEQAKQNAKQDSAAKRSSKAPASNPAPAKKKATNKGTQKPAQKVEKEESGNVGQWLKGIFLGGKLPGETDEAYHARLVSQTQPATMPFK